MSRLFIITYGDKPESKAILNEFIRLHTINNGDTIVIIASFDSEVMRTQQIIQENKSRIQQEIIQAIPRAGMSFGGQQPNAILEYVSQVDMQLAYSRVHGLLTHLLTNIPFNSCICTYGDAHPQVMIATVNACLRMPAIKLVYMQNNMSRIMTSAGSRVEGLENLTVKLPVGIKYDYSPSTNIYYDIHLFIEKMNELLRIREYAAVNSSIIGKFLHNPSVPPEIASIITSQWAPLVNAMKSWNDFAHEDAYRDLYALKTHIETLLRQRRNLTQMEQDELSKIEEVSTTINTYMQKLYHLVVHKQNLDKVSTHKQNGQINEINNIKNELQQYNERHGLHGYELPLDKYTNAIRAMEHHRYDDAIVRLNSVLEDLARMRLFLRWGIVVNNIRQKEFNRLIGIHAQVDNAIVNVSRRDLYNILRQQDRNDSLWLKYKELGGNSYDSSKLEDAVRGRHKSYLVHGNSIISQSECETYATIVKHLINAAVGSIVDFDAYQMPHIEIFVNFYPQMNGKNHELAINMIE